MQPLSAQQQQMALPFAERSFSHLDLTSQVRPCCQCAHPAAAHLTSCKFNRHVRSQPAPKLSWACGSLTFGQALINATGYSSMNCLHMYMLADKHDVLSSCRRSRIW
jgi:hypothetical protein